jgi:AraC family transcriptional regulator, regulatory protein of adaptative response / methylated-DNA-[protein]-cysteine methyltransferase
LRYTMWKSSLGKMLAVASEQGLAALRFCDKDQTALLAETRRAYPNCELVEDAKSLQPLIRLIEEVFAGEAKAESVPLDPVGTTFQRNVWRHLAKVPWGVTVSYSDLARKVGKPRAVRAVASACARNPVAVIVPCHRVLRKDGNLGGYYFGLPKKRLLLDRERPS